MQLYKSSIPNLYTDTITGAKGVHNVMVYLPPDYKTKQYPCVYFFNGKGEDTVDVSVLAKWGILSQISATNQPPCVAMCVQAVGWDNQQNQIYTTLKARYNFGKVILTGISEGGWVCTAILGGINMPGYSAPGPNNPVQKDTVCFIPMSAQIDKSVYTAAVVSQIAKLGIPVIGFGDDSNKPGDVWGNNTHSFINLLIAADPQGNYKFISTPGTGHGGWNVQSAFSYKLPGTSSDLWDWALSFAGGGTITPPPPPPTKTITSAGCSLSDGTVFTTSKPVKSVVFNYVDGTSETKP